MSDTHVIPLVVHRTHWHPASSQEDTVSMPQMCVDHPKVVLSPWATGLSRGGCPATAYFLLKLMPSSHNLYASPKWSVIQSRATLQTASVFQSESQGYLTAIKTGLSFLLQWELQHLCLGAAAFSFTLGRCQWFRQNKPKGIRCAEPCKEMLTSRSKSQQQ